MAHRRGLHAPVRELDSGLCVLCSNAEGGSTVGPFGQIK